MKNKKWMMVPVMIMLVLLSSCGGSKSDDSAQNPKSPEVKSTEITVGTLDSADGFDPTSNSNCGLGLSLVYDPMLLLDYETGELQPNLVESWEYLDDLTLKLKIRENVLFSNGEVMTPEDVLFSMHRFIMVKTRFDPGYDVIDFENSLIDGYTLTLKLFEPSPDLLYGMCNDRWAAVVSKSYVESTDADAFWDKPVGTGAYICTENTAGSMAVYERREDYWGDTPDASKITIRFYSESTTMLVDFINGVLDIALDVGKTDYLAAKDGQYDNIKYKVFPTYDILSLTMPEYMPIFDDIRIREAVALALDVTSICNAVYGELGTVADSCMIEGARFYESIGVNEYNPEKSRELIAEARYKPGEIELLMLFPSMPVNDKAATIVQAQLAEVGITLKVESGDFATVIPRLMNNECEIGLSGTGGGTFLARDILAVISETTTNAACRITDPELNKWIKLGDTSMDDQVRADAYLKAQQRCPELYRYIPIGYSNAVNFYQPGIENLVGIIARHVNLRLVKIN